MGLSLSYGLGENICGLIVPSRVDVLHSKSGLVITALESI